MATMQILHLFSTVAALFILAVTSSASEQRRGTGTSAILPAHVLLKGDPSQLSSSVNLARPGRLGPTGGGSRQRAKPTLTAGRRGSPTILADDDEGDEDERLQSQIDRSSKVRLRPSPDNSVDGLPVLPLIHRNRPQSSLSFSSSSLTSSPADPTASDLDARTLLSLLGSDFDATFMSAVRPSDSVQHPNGTFLSYVEDVAPAEDDETTAAAASLMRLPAIRLPGRTSTRLTAVRGREARRRLQRYLSAYSHCPLFVRWRDLGRRFWPRWIREGSCREPLTAGGTSLTGGNGSGRERSCSIPAGMTCRPNQSSTKTVLWWHCRTPSSKHRPGIIRQNAAAQIPLLLSSSSSSSTSGGNANSAGSICGWIPIKYPVITDCKCAC